MTVYNETMDNYESFTLSNTVEEYDRLMDVLNEKNSLWEIPQKIQNRIYIVIDEVVSNIINYSGATQIKVEYGVKKGEYIYAAFHDNGMAYNPFDTKAPDLTASAEEREMGGLGVFMIKRMTKESEYKYKDNWNIFRMTFQL